MRASGLAQSCHLARRCRSPGRMHQCCNLPLSVLTLFLSCGCVCRCLIFLSFFLLSFYHLLHYCLLDFMSFVCRFVLSCARVSRYASFHSNTFHSILFDSILLCLILPYSILFCSGLLTLFYSTLFYAILFNSILFYSLLLYSILSYLSRHTCARQKHRPYIPRRVVHVSQGIFLREPASKIGAGPQSKSSSTQKSYALSHARYIPPV